MHARYRIFLSGKLAKLGCDPKKISINVLFVAVSKEYLTRDIYILLPFRNRFHKIHIPELQLYVYLNFGHKPTRHRNCLFIMYTGIRPLTTWILKKNN